MHHLSLLLTALNLIGIYSERFRVQVDQAMLLRFTEGLANCCSIAIKRLVLWDLDIALVWVVCGVTDAVIASVWPMAAFYIDVQASLAIINIVLEDLGDPTFVWLFIDIRQEVFRFNFTFCFLFLRIPAFICLFVESRGAHVSETRTHHVVVVAAYHSLGVGRFYSSRVHGGTRWHQDRTLVLLHAGRLLLVLLIVVLTKDAAARSKLYNLRDVIEHVAWRMISLQLILPVLRSLIRLLCKINWAESFHCSLTLAPNAFSTCLGQKSDFFLLSLHVLLLSFELFAHLGPLEAAFTCCRSETTRRYGEAKPDV